MMKLLRMWQLLAHLLALIGATRAECNVCQPNQAACINSTSFHLCFGANTPNTDYLYHCPAGFECTDLNAICAQANYARPPSCGDTSKCGLCSAHNNYLFACHSLGIYQMCYGNVRPTGPLGRCPLDYVCDASSDAICVHKNSNPDITCNRVDNPIEAESTSPQPTVTSPAMPSTITTESTVSTSANPLPTLDAVCAQYNREGLFVATPHDPYCKRYIQCRQSADSWIGIEHTCGIDFYFEIEHAMCTYRKPAYCL